MDTFSPNLAEPAPASPAALLAAQREAYEREGAPSREERLASLAVLDRLLRANREPIATAIAADFAGRSTNETDLAELVPALASIRNARRHLARWMRPERRQVDIGYRPGRAWVQHQPLGCVAIVAPWNYPLLLTISPLVDALAAGNRVILKPSELVPRFSALLAELLGAAFDPALLAVVTGGPEVAQAVCALPLDHLLFTGSTAVGRLVARAAAETLTPVTLELGGKSPAIVCPDADLAAAAKIIAQGKFFNAGQTCIAPDYALVPEAQARAFADAVLDATATMYPRLDSPDYTSVISERHAERLRGLVAGAAATGATVLRRHDDEPGRRLAPTVVLAPSPDGALMAEEIFGPVLPVIGYRDLAEALRFVNDRPRPLALYPFTRDRSALATLLDGTLSGGVAINSVLMHCIQDDLPFGGVGASGIGAYHGHDGFKRFSHARGVYAAGRVSGFGFLAPPYGRRIRIALKAMLMR